MSGAFVRVPLGSDLTQKVVALAAGRRVPTSTVRRLLMIVNARVVSAFAAGDIDRCAYCDSRRVEVGSIDTTEAHALPNGTVLGHARCEFHAAPFDPQIYENNLAAYWAAQAGKESQQ